MTYYTIEITNVSTLEVSRFVNARNLGFAWCFADKITATDPLLYAVVIDQETGAVMSQHHNGEPTYMDLDPYAGY